MATEFDSFPVVQAATEDPFAAFPLADDGFDAFPLANAAVAEEEIAGGIKMVAGKEGPLAFVAGTYIPTDVLFPEGKGFMAGEVTPERYEQALAKVNAMTAEEASKIGARVDQAQFSQPKVVIPEAEQAELSRLENAQNEFSRSAFSAALQPAQALALADRALFERSELGRVGEMAAQRGQMFEGWQQSAREAYPTDPRYQGEFLASTLPQAAGSVLPFALAGQGGAVLSSSVGALMTAQSEYDSAKAAGASEEAARKAALVGLPIGLLEGLGPIGKSFDRPGGFKSWLGGAIKEGMQEVSQSGLQTLNASYISRYDPNRRMSGKELLETGAAGALIGGGMTAVPAYLNRGVTPDDGTGIIPEEEGPDYDSILREIEDRDEPDLSGFGSSNPAAQTPAPPAITPEQQISATILGEDPTELRQQEAIVDGTTPPAVEEEVVEEEVVEEPIQEAPILDAPEAVEAPLSPEEGQDTTQAPPEATAAPEGLSVLDPDSYERLADEPVAEGFVAYQDPATNDIFQVPQDATPELIQTARERARSESLEAEFEMLRKEQQRLDEVARTQKQLLSGPPIYKKNLVPAEPVKTVWRDVDKLTFTLDREKGRLAEAKKNLARLQSSANQRAKQEAAEEVKVRTRGVEILQSRVDELTPKVEEAKKAVNGMRKKPNQGEAGFVTLPQPLVDLGIALHRGGVEFKEWSRSMLKNVGDQVRPFLKQIWDAVVKSMDRLAPANRRAPSTSGMRRSASTEGGAIGSAGGRRQPPPPQTPPAAPQTAPEPLSIANENTSATRDRIGSDPRVIPIARKFPQVWAEATAIMAEDPVVGQNLVTSLVQRPRPTSDVEGAILLYERVMRDNRYTRSLKEAGTASTTAQVQSAQENIERDRKALEQVIEAAEVSGTATARGLAIRAMTVNRELSLERMLDEERAVVNRGKELSPDQTEKIKKLYDELKKRDARIKELEEKEREETSKAEADTYFKQLLKDINADRRTALKEGRTVTEFLNDQAEKARARLRDKMVKVGSAPDPTILIDLSIIGASKIANGIKSLSDFTAQMVSELGEAVRPYMNDAFTQAQALHEAEEKAFKKKDATPSRTEVQETPAQVLKRATSELDPRVVFDLARAYVRQGMTGMENVMQAVHADLVKLNPELTVREVRDAFSGYGKATYPSKAEDLVKLREYKRLAMLTSQLEDVLKRQAPLRSGPQRDRMTAEARILQRQINDTMKALGIQTTSPEQQLKTAADAVKTRLRNQIEELDRAIQTNQALPSNRRTVQYDEEAKALQARRDALRSRYDEIFRPQGRTQEEKIQAILKNLDKSIAAEAELLRNGIFRRPPNAPQPTSTDIENKRMELDAMRQLRRELYAQTQPRKSAEDVALEQALKAARASIDRMDQMMKTGNLTPAQRAQRFNPTAELEALWSERDAMRDALAELRKATKPRTDPEEIRRKQAVKALEKSIAQLDFRLLNNDFSPTPRRANRPEIQQVSDLRDIRDSMREVFNELKKAQTPQRSPLEIRLQRDKKMLRTRIQKLRDRLARREYANPPKVKPPSDPEKRQLQFEYSQLEEERLKGLFEATLRNRNLAAKVGGTILESLNTARAIMTSVDLPPVFRQGGFIALGNWKRAAKAVIPALKSFASERAAADVMNDIRDRPYYKSGLYQEAGLFIADDAPASLSRMEEAYMSRWIADMKGLKGGIAGATVGGITGATLGGGVAALPGAALGAVYGTFGGFQGSQRAYTAFLNKLRADSFDAMVATLTPTGTPNLEEAKAAANYINVATGRGRLPGRMAASAEILNATFFAPRYVLSRFQLIAAQPFYGGNAKTRRLIAWEYAKFLGGVSIVMALGLLFKERDDETPVLELDWTSSDFLKLRFGNTRIDFFAGLLQGTVLIGRTAEGETKGPSGLRRVTRGEDLKYGNPSGWDILVRFARTKFSPAVGAIADTLDGKNVIGDKVTPWDTAARFFVPISTSSVVEAMIDQGVPRGAALSVASMFGAGLQTYEKRESKAKKKDSDYTAKPF